MISASTKPSPKAGIAQIQELALSHFGLDLRSGKEELITARIGTVMRRQNLASFKDYYEYVIADSSGAALTEMVDALTTNFTSFFRESAHFDLLRKRILPALKGTSLRIWSAGCSSGEEPYTVGFHLHDAGLDSRSAEIVATDISGKVLKKASAGVYSEDDLKEVPADAKKRYFLEGIGSKKGLYRVKPEIREMVQFKRHNLLQPFATEKPFDVIFCRNVMIYFNKVTQRTVLGHLTQRLKSGGYLLIGHSESLNGLDKQLKYVCPAVYQSVT
jgi:chemotaxis protein methyltransferase CheR